MPSSFGGFLARDVVRDRYPGVWSSARRELPYELAGRAHTSKGKNLRV